MRIGRSALAGAWLDRARRHGVLALVTGTLAVVATRAVLERTGGEPAVPLDDTFIHFQYARSWAELRPLVYSPGDGATPGATSLLWPLLLAPLYALGLQDTSLIWAAWALGWICLAWLAHETRRLAEGLVSAEVALAAAAMVLLFGGYVWFAGSGMEVVPFALVLTRTARRSADWSERRADVADATGASRVMRARVELCLLGALAPLWRPEGVIATLVVVATLARYAGGASRCWALLPLAGPALLTGTNLLLTGEWTTTTMQVKWLPSSPYRHELWDRIGHHADLLVNTLLDGRVWSSVFVPAGGKLVTWLALPALLVMGWRRGVAWRAAVTLTIALGMAIPITYDTFLVNRLRYLWPFAAAWFVALAALAELAGHVAARVRPELGAVRLLVAGGFAGALASRLSPSIEDLAVSCDAIRLQQVALARWARDELPPDAILGVNDAGAIAYLSGRRTFDVVGLTTLTEGRYWVAGAGSRFEHYERLGRERLPTHFILYESWFGVPALLGDRLTYRTVTGATILGDPTKGAFRADFDGLGSGALPLDPAWRTRPVVDELDVADLESETAHRYELFWATKMDNLAFWGPDAAVDGGRRARRLERFELQLAGDTFLVGRWQADEPLQLTVRVAGETVGIADLTGLDGWEEVAVGVFAALPPGVHSVEVSAPSDRTFASLHYWAMR